MDLLYLYYVHVCTINTDDKKQSQFIAFHWLLQPNYEICSEFDWILPIFHSAQHISKTIPKFFIESKFHILSLAHVEVTTTLILLRVLRITYRQNVIKRIQLEMPSIRALTVILDCRCCPEYRAWRFSDMVL